MCRRTRYRGGRETRCSVAGIVRTLPERVGRYTPASVWPRCVTAAGRVPRSETAAPTRWWRRGAASTRTSRRCGSSWARRRSASMSARAASRPARSSRPSSLGASRAVPPSRPEPSLVRFRAAVEGALAHIESRRAEINDLNVFPVADGDTGDNMALTLRACLDEVDRRAPAEDERTIDEIGRDQIVESVARAALLGARGNSGVILSQLVRGAAEELISRPGELVDPVLVAAALARPARLLPPVVAPPGRPRAAARACGSAREPAEGTILTVAREMAGRMSSEL